MLPTLKAVFVCGVLLLVLTPWSWGQARPAATQQITPEDAAKQINQTTEKLLQYYAQIAGMPVPPEVVANIEQILASTKRVQGLIRNKPDKAYIDLLEAWVAHLKGDGDTAIKQATRAYNQAPEQPDVRDSYLFFLVYWENYEKAQSVMKRLKTGQTARQVAQASFKAHSETAITDTRAIPEMLLNEPNIPGLAPQEPNNPFNPQPARPAATRQQNRDGGMGFGVGAGLGAAAPVDPTFMDGGMGGMGGQMGGMPGGGMGMDGMGGQNQVQGITKTLNFNPDYLLFEPLGQEYRSLQMQALNGSWFQYDPAQGGVLCLLLWTLPAQQQATGQDSFGMNYGGMNYGGMDGMGGQAPQQTVAPLLEASGELAKNFDQFRTLFSQFVLIAPSMQFASVCLNDPGAMGGNSILKMAMDEPCPWTYLIRNAMNKDQLKDLPVASPVMMIVGASGKIRYVGPVGGLLPVAILNQEFSRARLAGGGMPDQFRPVSPASSSGSVWGILGQTVTGSVPAAVPGGVKTQSQPATPAQPAATQTQPVAAQPKPAAPTQPLTADPEIQRLSVGQARQRLQVAETQKRIRMYMSALEACDEILVSWPDSVEAEEAREMIRSILFSRPIYKSDRVAQGKWVPQD